MIDGPNGHDPDDDPEAESDVGLDDEGEDGVVEAPALTEKVDATIADILDDLVEEFADVERREGPDGVDYLVGPQPFARSVGTTGHFRLRPEIAEAALRTPGVNASPLGREWVAFAPDGFDQYALDRAQSWFELGHRLAAEGSRGGRRRH